MLLLACAACAAAAGKPAKKHAHRSGARTLAIRVEADKNGRTIPPSFLGLSIEHPDLLDYTGSAGGPNLAFIRLMQMFESFGNGSPTLRIGGHSTDQSWWNPAGAPRPHGVITDIDQSWLGGLASVAARAHTPVVLGLNLGIRDPANALEFAQTALNRLPAGSLRSFEIGNEPDLFTKPRTFHVGRRILKRERHRDSYNFDSYTKDLDPYLAALYPLGTTLAAGGFAGRDWTSRTRELLVRGGRRVRELSVHSYGLQTCGRARKRGAARLIHRLLLTRRSIKRIAKLGSIARKQGVALRVSETNSAVCGGVGRVSNAFASALWGADSLFGFMKAGAVSANLHTWTGAWYAPFEFRYIKGRRVGFVRPLFYGMLLFAKATANHGQLLRTHWRGHTRVRVWSTRGNDGKLRVMALNVDRRISRELRIRIPGVGGRAIVERLTAPSLGARHRIKLGGRSFGRSTTSGRMLGRLAKTRVPHVEGTYRLRLPAAQRRPADDHAK